MLVGLVGGLLITILSLVASPLLLALPPNIVDLPASVSLAILNLFKLNFFFYVNIDTKLNLIDAFLLYAFWMLSFLNHNQLNF